jgi:hypothetical protein
VVLFAGFRKLQPLQPSLLLLRGAAFHAFVHPAARCCVGRRSADFCTD